MANSRQQPAIDELFDIKNSFYTGAFQQTINEAQKIKPSTSELQMQRDIFLYRAYIAQRKYRIVLDEIHGTSPAELRPLRLLADYLANPNKREALLDSVKDQLSGSADLSNHTFVIVAATLFCYDANYEAALRVLHQEDSLESSAMNIQIFLQMDRVDLARKELKSMQEKDEDSTLTQLAQAWVNNAMGGEKLQDAFYIYQELIDKYGSTPMLLNGQAVSLIGQGKYEEAEAALQEVMDKDSNNPDTLVNMIVLTRHLSRPSEVCNRYLAQMKDSYGDHQFVKDYHLKETEFERLAQQYSKVVS
ncbi:coatomer subunit epsilon [Macrosteles quadrilineatus]|uniref:coatomer subunit epsilon n=1 Tax=Macrosteles quadrilineatus TaxID=74068 RepID=UPI0023E23167|nr:coatomer subunit epsilon [Macrosteles quadrilineatus]